MGFDGRFAYAVGRIRALENRMIDQARFNRLIDSESPEELARILGETEYGQASDVGPGRFEEIIDAELVRVHDLVAGMSPDPLLTGVFRARHDFHNVKVYLKARLAARDRGIAAEVSSAAASLGWFSPDEVGIIVDHVIGRADEQQEGHGVSGGDAPVGGVGPQLGSERAAVIGNGRATAATARLRAALEGSAAIALSAYNEHGRDPQQIDMASDRESFNYFYTVAKSRNAAFLESLIAEMADLTNILISVRLRAIGKTAEFAANAFVPHGSLSVEWLASAYAEPDEKFAIAFRATPYERLVDEGLGQWRAGGSLAPFENLVDSHLAAVAARSGGVPIGYEVVLGYLLAREAEADTLRRIFVGKMNRIPASVIRERLCGAHA